MTAYRGIFKFSETLPLRHFRRVTGNVSRIAAQTDLAHPCPDTWTKPSPHASKASRARLRDTVQGCFSRNASARLQSTCRLRRVGAGTSTCNFWKRQHTRGAVHLARHMPPGLVIRSLRRVYQIAGQRLIMPLRNNAGPERDTHIAFFFHVKLNKITRRERRHALWSVSGTTEICQVTMVFTPYDRALLNYVTP